MKAGRGRIARGVRSSGPAGFARLRRAIRPLPLILAGLACIAMGKGVLLLVAGGPAPTDGVVTPSVAQAGRTFAQPVHLLEPAAGPGSGGRDAGASPDAAARPASIPGVSRFTPKELELLTRLDERRARLDERSKDLDLREALLDDAEKRIEARLEQLEELKASIETMVRRHNEEEDEKLASLVKIYETMRPKAAAEIFDQLDMDVLVEVVSRMSENKSSDVIGRMEPDRAESLTAELARRRRLPIDVPGGDTAG